MTLNLDPFNHFIGIYTYIDVYIYTCICICTYIYTCIHIYMPTNQYHNLFFMCEIEK